MTEQALEDARAWIFTELLRLDGVSQVRSRFADREALFFAGQELLHFDEPGLADLRLGRSVIRSRRDELQADAAVTVRSGDWVHVRFTDLRDAEIVVRWTKVRIDGVA